MNGKNVVQHNLRLSLYNPEHVLIHQTLKDLNLDIHKSINNFIIEALLHYIKGTAPEQLTNSAKEDEENRQGYLTRKEFDDAVPSIINSVIARVNKELLSTLFTTMIRENIKVPDNSRAMIENYETDNAAEYGMSKEVADTLSALADQWS